ISNFFASVIWSSKVSNDSHFRLVELARIRVGDELRDFFRWRARPRERRDSDSQRLRNCAEESERELLEQSDYMVFDEIPPGALALFALPGELDELDFGLTLPRSKVDFRVCRSWRRPH